jgi:hypothetical protein
VKGSVFDRKAKKKNLSFSVMASLLSMCEAKSRIGKSVRGKRGAQGTGALREMERRLLVRIYGNWAGKPCVERVPGTCD